MEKISFKKAIILGFAFIFTIFFLINISFIKDMYFQSVIKEYISENTEIKEKVKFLLNSKKNELITTENTLISNDEYTRGFSNATFIIGEQSISNIWIDSLDEKFDADFFVIKKDRILSSTISINSKRISNEELIFLSDLAKYNEMISVVEFNKQKYGLSFVDVTDYYNNVIAQIGIGFNISELEKKYGSGLNKIIMYESILLFIIMLAFYFVFIYKFRFYDRIVEKIVVMKNGDYNSIIESKNRYFKEFDDIAVTLEKVSLEVKKREDSLVRVNKELEAEIQERTVNLENTIEKLGKTQEKLIAKEKLIILGKFAGKIAHDLNSPLSAILTTTQMLKDEVNEIEKTRLKKSIKESLEIIEEGTYKSKDVIKRLVKYSSNDSKRVEKINLTKLLIDSVNIINDELKKYNIKVILKVGDFFEITGESIHNIILSDRAEIFGDGKELLQLFTNVLENAKSALISSQFSNREILINILSDNYNVNIEIRDNGKGINAKLQKKIFDPFFSSGKTSEHLGLGLSISRDIVSKHNGKMEINSEESNGTTVKIIFKKDFEV